MKKYWKDILLVGAIIAVIHYNHENKELRQQDSQPVVTPTPAITEVITTPVPKTDEEIAREISEKARAEKLLIYANEDLYRTLSTAYDNFNRFYANGEASTQMRNSGTYLSDNDASNVDSNMRNMYQLLSNYVNAFQSGDYDTCAQIGEQIYNMNGLEKIYFYNLLVNSKIPNQYRDGRNLCLIGPSDLLICGIEQASDLYNSVQIQAKWISTIPNIILDQYQVIDNSNGDDGNCYIWNQSNVERTCGREWSVIREQGKSMYGVDPSTVHIRWSDEANTYYYEDQNDVVYGPLDPYSNQAVDHIYEIQDAMVFGSGNVYALDGFLKDMVSTRGYSYTK